MDRLRDHVAIVTGSSRGIGKATAEALAREGASVVLAARSSQALDATVGELSKAKIIALAIPTDVTIVGEVKSLVQNIVDRFNRIGILVNNAGVDFFRPVVEMNVSDLDEMWNVNMRGPFIAVQAVLPHMIRARTGAVVNIGSLAGKNSVK
jgi:3-oxoacyl-[acyl-carrier protein] reductase